MYPLVVIKTFGKHECVDIIKEILRINHETVLEPMNISIDSHKLIVYKLSICTKYYKTQVLLYECNDINSIPNGIKNKIEGAIFYFDANDVNFESKLESLAAFVKNNNIGVATLITHNENDSNEEGLSYDVIKKICKHDINIIDLNSKFNNEEPTGYAEVLDMLKNNVWSSVNITNSNSNNINNDGSDVDIEDALSEFEELLNKFQQFKAASQNMSREEVFQNAENLAELFANMLNEE